MGFLETPLILFLTIVAPLWILLHYLSRWRAGRGLSADDEKMLGDLWESAGRMEERIRTLEKILDDQSPDWREKT
ncbi:MAG: envelope stress response membrane protein PspB [Rhodospirillaceae bacterium]